MESDSIDHTLAPSKVAPPNREDAVTPPIREERPPQLFILALELETISESRDGRGYTAIFLPWRAVRWQWHHPRFRYGL